jgi:hypothetical protein
MGADGVAQGTGPDFKPSTTKKERKKKNDKSIK